MKHLLNNISEEEKNRIREQHEGGMKISTENFKKLLEAKSGEVKPYLSEQTRSEPTSYSQTSIDKVQKPIKLRLFPIKVVSKSNEEGAYEEFLKTSDQADYFIEVNPKPMEVDNDEVTFEYKVRGRSEKDRGYYNPNERGEDVVSVDWCTLIGRRDLVPVDGSNSPCDYRNFRLSNEGAELMNDSFGTDGYAMVGGNNNSNVA